MTKMRITVLTLVVAVQSGCTLHGAPPTKGSPVALPPAWSHDQVAAAAVRPWLADFEDVRLSALVDQAVTENFELRAVLARVAAARAQMRIAGADRLPQFELSAQASRSERRAVGVSEFAPNPSDSFDVQGEISWEADLWGRLAHATRASIADFEASRADFRGATQSLAANLAREWFLAIEAGQQQRLAQRTVASFKDSLASIEQQYRRGIGNALDVRLARQNLATAQSNLAFRQRQLRSAIRTLELLLGRYPEAGLEIADALPRLATEVPVGLPSQLLARRPDLVAAERRLVAADERFRQARRDRLPRFRLTASGGASSDAIRDLLDADNLIWSLIGGVTQPVFDGGRLRAGEALAEARANEAFNAYAQAVLSALREVENTLDAETYLQRQQDALEVAAREARQAEQLALDRYAQGLTDIVTLLEAQRRSFNSDSSLLETARQRLQNRVNLYLALGGDFAAAPARSPPGSERRTQ